MTEVPPGCGPQLLRHQQTTCHKIITQGIIRSITFRDTLYLKMKLFPKYTPEYTAIKINLKTYNNILKRNIRQAKFLYYQHQFDQYKTILKRHGALLRNL